MPGFAPVGSTPVGALSTGSGPTGTASATLTTVGHGYTISAHGAGAATAHLTAAAVGRALHSAAPGTASASLTSAAAGRGLRPYAPGTASAQLISVGVALGIRPTTGTAVASMFASNAVRVAASASSGVLLRSDLSHTGGYAVTLTSGVVADASITAKLGVVITERIRISLGSSPLWHMNIAIGDTVSLRDALRHLLQAALSDNLTLHDSFTTRLLFQILDKILLTSTFSGLATYQIHASEQVTLHEALVGAFGAHLADAIHLAATLTPLYKAIINAVENIEVSDTPAPVLAISGVILDDIDLTTILTPQALMGVAIMDLIVIDTGASEPNDTLSVWQMNTRTAAVTEYGNYPFNSFGRLNTAVYIGAADDGLYELIGPDDEGDPIVSVIRGGYLQFGETHLSRIKAAYIAVRGGGEMLLKIVTGPGQEYIYSANTQSMQSTKFQMGKGQRARYFAWELTSVGQDFDLDTLEFVPIEVQRRV